jgi:hypothetical protein
MGAAMYTPVGPKSSHDERKDVRTGEMKEIDYKDPVNMYRAKEELYTLFLEGKIVHLEKLEKLEDELKEVRGENEKLKRKMQEELERRNIEAQRKQGIVGSRRPSIGGSSHNVERRGQSMQGNSQQ